MISTFILDVFAMAISILRQRKVFAVSSNNLSNVDESLFIFYSVGAQSTKPGAVNMYEGTMNDIAKLPAAKLKRILELRTEIERLEGQISAIAGGRVSSGGIATAKSRTMSPAARRKISLAAKARWARVRAEKKSKAA